MLPAEITRHRFTVEEYHKMAEAGVFSEDDRVELMEGEVLQMTPIGWRHARCVSNLNMLLARFAGTRYVVRAGTTVKTANCAPRRSRILPCPKTRSSSKPSRSLLSAALPCGAATHSFLLSNSHSHRGTATIRSISDSIYHAFEGYLEARS
jgi:hypothetical protein